MALSCEFFMVFNGFFIPMGNRFSCFHEVFRSPLYIVDIVSLHDYNIKLLRISKYLNIENIACAEKLKGTCAV